MLSFFILRAVEIQCQPLGRKITEGLVRRLRNVPARDRADPQSNDLREVSPLAVKRAATVRTEHAFLLIAGEVSFQQVFPA